VGNCKPYLSLAGCDHLQRRKACRRAVHRFDEAGEVLEPLASKASTFQKQTRIPEPAQLSDRRILKLYSVQIFLLI
jgi:hypothetical protein